MADPTASYLAKPSGDCCLRGSIHEGSPRGTLETIAGVDTYAGYLALGLDYFRGDPVYLHRDKPGFDFPAWKDKHMPFSNEVVPKWVEAMAAKYGGEGTRFACIGYCWGAPYVCDQLAGDVVSAGAFAHPAFLQERHFVDLKKPLLLPCAETNHTFDAAARNKAVDMLHVGKKAYHLQLFSGVSHGFVLRGDVKDLYQRWTREQSLRGMIDWFDLWLSQ